MTSSDENFEHLDDLFLDLKILAEVGQHEKISTQSSEITVQPNSLTLALTRWFRGETREVNIHRIADVLNKMTREIGEFTAERRRNDMILDRIRGHLLNARAGILNLCYTYQEDANTKAKLEIQVDKLDNLVGRIDVFVSWRGMKKDQ
jgi:hypothetical protein